MTVITAKTLKQIVAEVKNRPVVPTPWVKPTVDDRLAALEHDLSTVISLLNPAQRRAVSEAHKK